MSKPQEPKQEYVEMQRELERLKASNRQLFDACQFALAHIEELEEAWRRGALSEHDGMGGTRSNRNVEARRRLLAAFDKTKGGAP